MAVGDIMLDRAVGRSVERNAGGDFSWLFASTTELADADILFGNLEGPLSDQGTELGNLYSFRMSPAAAPALAAAGFDALSLANNHIGDWGVAAAIDTPSQLERVGIMPVGVGHYKEEAASVKIIEKKGKKIGFLAFSDVGPGWLTAGIDKPGIILGNDAELGEIITKAAAQVDILAVSFHFGEEYQPLSSARQQTLAHLAIDHGALLVLGAHPHVTQEVERYGRGLIAYSLGNFIFDQYFSPETMKGLVLEVEINPEGAIVGARTRESRLDRNFRPSLTEIIHEY
jgi:poly-gamma-glutamate synthesis protein (capsule biosynthesis protein)